ncbi:hypothetical protein ACJJIC_17720 [Microbulbifer sp. ANSA002]|uniref:hypothetical protein n=1 Tax=unclassified Microbulbifer TaxID=2619833 RepID=UPI0040421F01
MKKVVLFFLCVFVTACSGTGGIIGGLIPAPKFLEGEVEGDMYIAEGCVFQVGLPHPPSIDGYEWTYTKVHEHQEEKYTKVVFGPAAFNINYYHVTLVNTPSIDDISKHSEGLFNQLTKMQPYREVDTAEQLVNTEIEINGNKGFYVAFKMGPSQWLLCGVVYLNQGYYVVEADISRSFDGMYNPSEETVKNREYQIFNRLLETFTKQV